MARGKSIYRSLLNSSESAIFAGIEIHNKPHISYRYQTTVILIINAWELALKAFMYKYIDKKKIYENNKKDTTISFVKSLKIVNDYINSREMNGFCVIYENLILLNQYRCSIIHFYEKNLDPVIFMLLGKAVLNYSNFLKKYLKSDITNSENLVILPIGLKLPFNPIRYLKQEYNKIHNDFIDVIIQKTRLLAEHGITESILVDFDLCTVKQKKIENADLIATIDQNKGSVSLRKEYILTDNPLAPAVQIEDVLPPLTFNDFKNKIKMQRPDIKLGKRFYAIKKYIEKDRKLCRVNYLNPKDKEGTKKKFYTNEAVDSFIKFYDSESI